MIVLDCSAAIEIARGTTKGLELAKVIQADGGEVVSPDIYCSDVVAVFAKLADEGHDLAPSLAEALALPSILYKSVDIALEAYGESIHYGCDAHQLFYAILARRQQAKLMTLDKQLIELCKKLGVKTLTA